MELGAGGFTIRYTSVADHRFDVFRGDAEVGSVRCVRPESSRTRIALPPHWPLREQIFVFWLALFMRERALASRWG